MRLAFSILVVHNHANVVITSNNTHMSITLTIILKKKRHLHGL